MGGLTYGAVLGFGDSGAVVSESGLEEVNIAASRVWSNICSELAFALEEKHRSAIDKRCDIAAVHRFARFAEHLKAGSAAAACRRGVLQRVC